MSLEYLLLLAAFFSVLLLMLPLIQRTYALALFGFDARQALSFSKQFSESVKQLSILSDGSALTLEINPMHEWRVAASGKKLAVEVSSKNLEKTKTIETELIADVSDFENNFSEKTTFLLKKRNGALVVNSNP